ncbi:MAG: class I SAM-dependent methyltransferase [Candidatus Binataceae bacterium]
MALYDRIGIGYDTTRHADPYLASRLIHHLDPHPGHYYLDLGCGTGNYTIEVAKSDARIIAMDQSPAMLATAKSKSGLAPNIAWNIANAESLPLADNRVEGAVCFLAHHHFRDVHEAFREVFRVLQPAHRLVVFNASAEQLRGCWLAAYFPLMMEQAITFNEQLDTQRRLREAGFSIAETELYDIAPDLQDWFLYCGKHDPARYLDARVRAGISTFAARPDAPEIAEGCVKLAADLTTGRFAEVASRYRSDRGDYTFWVARKP